MTKEELYGGKEEKPRICEVLGVEVNEEWVLNESIYSDIINRINADGNRETKDKGAWGIAGWELMLVEAINHPEKIKHLPRWTAEEKEQAKAVKTLYPWSIYVQKDDAAPSIFVYNNNDRVVDIYDGDEVLFPHLKGGKVVTLDEILEADSNDR